MFCENCGSKLPEDAVFCGNCGAKAEGTPEEAVISNGESKKKPFKIGRKQIIIAASVLAVIIIAAVSFFIYSNTGRRYLYTALAKTISAYSGELKRIQNDNPVLKTYSNVLSKPYIYEATVSDYVSMSFTDDRQNKIFNFNTEVKTIGPKPVEAGVYLSDDRLIAGVNNAAFVEVNPKALGDELYNVYDRIVKSSPNAYVPEALESMVEDYRDTFNAFDFSYSGIKNGTLFSGAEDIKEIVDLISAQALNLSEHALYDKTDSQLRIGGRNVKTTRVTLTMGPDETEAWLFDDLLPAVEESAALRKLHDLGGKVSGYEPVYEDTLNEFEGRLNDFVNEMTDAGGILVLGAHIYKGAVVEIDGWVLTDDYEDEDTAPGFELSATGDPYRLNNVSLTLYSPGHYSDDEFRITVSGDHFSKTNFETAVAVRQYGYTERVQIEWDLLDTRNNLKITDPSGNEHTLTLTAKDNTVEGNFSQLAASFTVKEFTGAVELPANTSSIQEFSPQEAMEQLNILDNFIYYGF